MLEFIKMFGLGILYTLLLPFIVAIFGCYLVYVFFNYLVIETKTLFGFFFGYTFSETTELEDKLEKMKLDKNHTEAVEENEVVYEYNSESIQETNVDIEKGCDEQ